MGIGLRFGADFSGQEVEANARNRCPRAAVAKSAVCWRKGAVLPAAAERRFPQFPQFPLPLPRGGEELAQLALVRYPLRALAYLMLAL